MAKKKKKGNQSRQKPAQVQNVDPFQEMQELIGKNVKDAEGANSTEDSKSPKPVSQTFLPTEKTVVSDVTVTIGNEDEIKSDIYDGCELLVKELIKKAILTPDNVTTVWDQGSFKTIYGMYARKCHMDNLLERYPDWAEFIENTFKIAAIFLVDKIQKDLEAAMGPEDIIALPDPEPKLEPEPTPQEVEPIPELTDTEKPIDLRKELHKSVEMVEPDPDMKDILNVTFPPVDMAQLPPYFDKDMVMLWKQFLMFKVKLQSAYCKQANILVTDEYFQDYLVDVMQSIAPSGQDCIDAAKEVGVVNASTKEIMEAGFCRAMRKKMRKECPDLFDMLAIA